MKLIPEKDPTPMYWHLHFSIRLHFLFTIVELCPRIEGEKMKGKEIKYK